LWFRQGDATNAVLAAAGYNFRRLIRWLSLLLRRILSALNAAVQPLQPETRVLHGRLSKRGERLSAAIRALDARSAGSSYRTVAEALFGKKRIPDRAWKTHDLRNRTVRLVKGGLTLVRGGYRKLLRPGRRNE
ncbi:DUF2285 domain-containing protein, partial [Bradyrhizobium sp. 146]|uniref:DUF2285 domain-containing protein n=1 Tax=Bradyrhizobium sp. 146 TaxID=2782622 RepID=UPI001FF7E655